MDELHEDPEIRQIAQAIDMNPHKAAQILQEYFPFDLETGEEITIERPERVQAPWQVLITMSPKSKRDHVIAQVEIYATGDEQVFDEKGRKSPLGGNMKMYWCPNCKLPILPSWHAGVFAICKHCQTKSKPVNLIGEVLLSHTPSAAAFIIAKIHQQLQFADLYFMRYLYGAKQEDRHVDGRMAFKVDEMLYRRLCVIYPFHKLIEAIHAKRPIELPDSEAHMADSCDFQSALEKEIRRYI